MPPTDSQAPAANFAHLLVSLGQSAFVALGETKGPGGATRPNPALAAHNLAILRILEEKTRGNLDEDEAKLLATLIEELGQKIGPAS